MGRPHPSDAASVAILGTRQCRLAAYVKAEDLAEGLANKVVPVVSGLASEIDSAVHRGALRACGRTVAVLGTGLRRTYSNTDLQRQISEVGLPI
jgi:DNA processing protein